MSEDSQIVDDRPGTGEVIKKFKMSSLGYREPSSLWPRRIREARDADSLHLPSVLMGWCLCQAVVKYFDCYPCLRQNGVTDASCLWLGGSLSLQSEEDADGGPSPCRNGNGANTSGSSMLQRG